MNSSLACKILFSFSYLFIILGSCGMIIFATKFPFSSCIRDLSSASERFMGLNGYQLWKYYTWYGATKGTVLFKE